MILRLLAIVGLLCGAAAVTKAAGPELEVSTSEFDFGFVPEHIDVSYVLWLYSRGDTAVTIYRLESDCPCIKTDLKGERLLEPGDSLAVNVRFNSHRFIERVDKYPVIHTNQGSGKHLLKVSAYVAVDPSRNRPLVIKPWALDISPIGDKVRDSMSFQLINQSDRTVHPTVVYMPPEVERINLPDEIGPGKTGHGEVILKQSVLGTEFLKSFTIGVDDDAKRHYTLPLKSRIRQ